MPEGIERGTGSKVLSSVGTSVLIVLSFLLALLIFPLILLLLAPIYILRLVVALSSRCAPKLGRILTTRSAIFAADAIYTQPLMVNVSRFIFDGVVDINLLEKLIDQNWLQARSVSSPTQLRYPELKQFITTWMGYAFWENDEEFNIKNHVRLYFDQQPGNFITEKEVVEAWNELSMKPFEEKRSPWEVLLVPYYRESRRVGDEKMKSVLIFRWHHALSDGFSVLNLLSALGTNFNTVARTTGKKSAGGKDFGARFLKGLTLAFKAPYLLLGLASLGRDSNVWHLEEEKMTRYWHLGVGKNLPISLVQEIKANFSVSFASVLLAAVTGSVRRMMVKAFEMNSLKRVPKSILCGVPFPLPNHPDKLRNHWAICTVKLPVGEENPCKRLQLIERSLKEMKRSSTPIIAYGISPWLGGLPNCIIKAVVVNRVTTIITSIMPGPPEPLKNFLGNTVLDAGYIIGCGPGRNGFSFSILSYGGNVKFTVTVDSALAPEERVVQELIVGISEELSFLKQICIQSEEV